MRKKKTLLGPHINSLKHGLANFLVLATIFAKKRVVVDYIKKDFKVFYFLKIKSKLLIKVTKKFI